MAELFQHEIPTGGKYLEDAKRYLLRLPAHELMVQSQEMQRGDHASQLKSLGSVSADSRPENGFDEPLPF